MGMTDPDPDLADDSTACEATDVDIDMGTGTDVNLSPDLAHGHEDPDDNAGDADAAGDGSAGIEDKFIEYDNPEDLEVIPGATSKTGFYQTQLVAPKKPKPKPTVLGMVKEDLVCVCSLPHELYLNSPIIRRESYGMQTLFTDNFVTKTLMITRSTYHLGL